MSRVFILLVGVSLAAPAVAQGLFIDGSAPGGGIPEADVAAAPMVGPMAHPADLLWPLDRPLGTDTYLSNYVDDDPASGSMIDYMGGRDHLYDGHRGTDVALVNFRTMDRGVAVLAAAGGVVQSTTFHNGDRNTDTPYPDGGNGLGILHDDGTLAYYWHVRRNSIVVEPGERVEAGQPLAFVGSAGWTPIPHLHFELSDARDPWQGTHHTAPSLWAYQPAYVGDAPIWMMDADVFTPEATGGSLAGLTSRRLKERLSAPVVVGVGERDLYAWTQVQANAGDRYVARLLDPSGAEVGSENQPIIRKTRYGWFAHELVLPGDAEPGTWRVRFTTGERTLQEVAFEVGGATVYGPRVSLPSSDEQQHVAGHSVRLDGAAQALELGVIRGTGASTFRLEDAPGYASLDGDVLRIAAGADQPYRSRAFRAIATDEAGRTDTMFVQVVHPGRPPAPVATSADGGPEAGGLGLRVAPNPARGAAAVSFDLAEAGPVRLVLLDALGREVAAVAEGERAAGPHAVPIGVEGLGTGVYTVRATVGETVSSARFVVVR